MTWRALQQPRLLREAGDPSREFSAWYYGSVAVIIQADRGVRSGDSDRGISDLEKHSETTGEGNGSVHAGCACDGDNESLD